MVVVVVVCRHSTWLQHYQHCTLAALTLPPKLEPPLVATDTRVVLLVLLSFVYVQGSFAAFAFDPDSRMLQLSMYIVVFATICVAALVFRFYIPYHEVQQNREFVKYVPLFACAELHARERERERGVVVGFVLACVPLGCSDTGSRVGVVCSLPGT